MTRLPAIFISHGMPLMAIDPGPTGHFLGRLAGRIPCPRAIVCISAHLEGAVPLVTADTWPETIHDFSGFPPDLHTFQYPAPGDPDLAERIVALLSAAGLSARTLPGRGLDHGAWVPLSLMYPEAKVPIVQLSVQTEEPASYHYHLGQSLAPLLDDQILILGSGGATHDLPSMANYRRNDPAAPYAEAFDLWLEAVITEGAVEDLLQYRRLAPEADRNHPFPAEHFLPLLVTAGAGSSSPTGERLFQHFEYGVLSLAAYWWVG